MQMSCVMRDVNKEIMKSGASEQLDYVLVNLLSHTKPKPDWEEALNYRKMYSAAGSGRGSLKPRNALKFHSESFKQFGSGVLLYFSLLQTLFYTFLVMSVMSLPAFLSNFKGNGLDVYDESITKEIMRVSLANQRYEQIETIHSNASVFTNMAVSQGIIIATDVMGSIVFLGFLIYWKIRSDMIVEQQVSEDVLPSSYTLTVKKLPEDYREDTLKQHFEKMGAQVAQISTVYHYENILNDLRSFLGLVEQYSAATLEQKREFLYSRIAQKYKEIKEMSKHKTPRVVKSIVTLEDMRIKQKIKDIYKYNICPEELKYNDTMIKVSSCKIEPSSILWENFHLGFTAEIKKGILIYILLFLILLATLIALFLVNARFTSFSEKSLDFKSGINYTNVQTYEQVRQNGSAEAIYVFCSKLNYQNYLMNYYRFCEQYFSAYTQKLGGVIIVATLVMIINILSNWIIYELANYRRYKTKTEKSRFLIFNIFMLSFINSALLILFIKLKIGDYSLGWIITNLFNLPEEQFSSEAYSDFDRKWYMNIASQVLMIHALSLMASPFIQILIGWAQSKLRLLLARRAKTQQEMNQTLKDSEFDFETFYAMTLNSCFFTMFYANAMPVLYILAMAAFFSLYVASYMVFKYFSCKPVMFDHSLNTVISKIMCFSLIIHQITSVCYFYTEDIFPLEHVPNSQANQATELVYYRSKFVRGLFFVVFAFLIAVFGINYNRACRVVRKYYGKYFHQAKSKDTKDPLPFSQVFGKDHSSCYLSSYKMEANPCYLDICYTMTILKMFHPYFEFTATTNELDEKPLWKIENEHENHLLAFHHKEPDHLFSDPAAGNHPSTSSQKDDIVEDSVEDPTDRPLY